MHFFTFITQCNIFLILIMCIMNKSAFPEKQGIEGLVMSQKIHDNSIFAIMPRPIQLRL